MKFELKKKLVAKSDKVKAVDFHPIFPWVLIGYYNGSISIYDYNSQACLQKIEVTSKPIRTVKFISEKSWLITGSDDFKIRVYNYNTMERIKEYEAHTDLIRSIVIQQKTNKVVSSSDDCSIKIWDSNNDFILEKSFEEHQAYVMKLAINPKDQDMLASGSTDKKIKIWSFNGKNSSLTIDGHTKGITSVAFCPMLDKPYLASSSDDKTIKIWDYTNKQCVATLESHEDIVSAIAFHPELPILISSGEDHYTKFWNTNTFKLEDSKMFGYDIAWDIAVQQDNNIIALGCDEATIVMRMGSEHPLAIFNQSQARVIYCKQNSLFSINLKTLSFEEKDGESINYSPKPLGTTELFPLMMKFSPNGRHFSVLSEKEFVISTSGIYRDTYAGKCTDFAWNPQGDFAIKDNQKVKFYKSNKEEGVLTFPYQFDNIFSGPLLGVKSSEAVYFYDFDTQVLIRKIDISVKDIIWSDNKSRVAIITEDSTFILKYNTKIVDDYIETSLNKEEDQEDEEEEVDCEDAFESIHEIKEVIQIGIWHDDIFIYHTNKNKINYLIGNQTFNITTLNGSYSLLGFYQSNSKIYLMNKTFNLISISLPLEYINYQSLILKKKYNEADEIFNKISNDYQEKICKFLEKFNLFELAFAKTTNLQRKLELAVLLKKLNEAIDIAYKLNNKENWKIIADLALDNGKFEIAEKSMQLANDYSGLLLYYSCISHKDKLRELGEVAFSDGNFNISFNCFLQINDVHKCVKILLDSNQIPEAALFCRTYCPSLLSTVLENWNEKLNEVDPSHRTQVRILNPIENNEKTIEESEKLIENYYSLTNTIPISQSEKWCSFINNDISEIVNNKSEFDIYKYLNIDINDKNSVDLNEIEEEVEENFKPNIKMKDKNEKKERENEKKNLINTFGDDEEEDE